MTVDIPRQLPEQHSEERSQKRARQVKPLSTKVISIVQFAPLQSSKQEPVDHVAKEVGLLVEVVGHHGDVRQHLLLEDLLSVAQPPIPLEAGGGAAPADEVERDRLVLDGESLLDGRLEHLKQLGVVPVVADVLEDVAVRNDAEGAEDDHDWDVGLDVRQGGADELAGDAAGRLFGARGLVHLDLHGGDGLAAFFDGGPDLGEVGDGGRARFGKDVDVVGRHALLGDEHLFGAVDDKVASL